jgi:hypothetical protein
MLGRANLACFTSSSQPPVSALTAWLVREATREGGSGEHSLSQNTQYHHATMVENPTPDLMGGVPVKTQEHRKCHVQLSAGSVCQGYIKQRNFLDLVQIPKIPHFG